MEKLRRENDSLKTELAMEFRQFRKPVDSSSVERLAQVRQLHSVRLGCKPFTSSTDTGYHFNLNLKMFKQGSVHHS